MSSQNQVSLRLQDARNRQYPFDTSFREKRRALAMEETLYLKSGKRSRRCKAKLARLSPGNVKVNGREGGGPRGAGRFFRVGKESTTLWLIVFEDYM